MKTQENCLCNHCGKAFLSNSIDFEAPQFCCEGCKAVYNLLKDNGLSSFYSLRKSSKIANDLQEESYYQYLDHPDILKNYGSYIDELLLIEFFVEGIHCLGCQFVLENLNRLHPNICKSNFDFEKSTITISLLPKAKISEVAFIIDSLGYKPRLIKERKEIRELQKEKKRKLLIKIGIAAACSGNIMLLSIANYAGADGAWRLYFDTLASVLALPVILFCAQPFYVSSLQAIKQKRISIDFPISLAIIIGSLLSYWSLYTHQDKIYFDSITGLVFLLLASRFLQKSIEEKAGQYFQKDQYFEREFAQKLDSKTGQYTQSLCEHIVEGDIVLVEEGDMIPFDGKVHLNNGHINEALLTGESKLRAIKKGDAIFQGTINAGETFSMEVESVGEKTRINKILQDLKAAHQSPSFLTVSDKIGTYFLLSVLTLGVILLVFFSLKGQTFIGLERAITLFIVTCPCALAIGTPLSFRQSYQWLFRRGIILRNFEPLEKVLQSKKIYLDKTGTLTEGKIEVQKFEMLNQDNNLISILFSLEKKSQHPIAYAIVHFLSQNYPESENIPFDHFQEVMGKGLEAKIGIDHYQVCGEESLQETDLSTIVLRKNGTTVVRLALGDRLKENTPFAINQLKKLGFDLCILSGDQKGPVEGIAHKLGIHYLSNLSPEDKARIISENPNSIMVGDGANDALSLKKSFMGLCMKGGLSLSLKVSDVFINNNDLYSIVELFQMGKITKKIIRRNLILSLFYNITAAGLACAGIITPLWAAVFMPLSSLTVIISNLIGTKKMRAMKRRLI
ncbi:MAG: heavy metal translocating P-type ATPase [Bacteriovoracaceae bacterium]